MRQRALEPLEIFVCFREELAGHAESDALHGQEHRSGSRDQRLEVVVEVGDLVGQRPDAPGQDTERAFASGGVTEHKNAFKINNWIRNSPITWIQTHLQS